MPQRIRLGTSFYVSLLILLIVLPAAVLMKPHTAALMSVEAGRKAAAEGNYSLASQDMAAAAVILSERAELWLLAGEYALQAADLDAARTFFEMADGLIDVNPDDWIALGDAYLESGEGARAAAAWEKALGTGGPSIELFERLLDLHQETQDYAGAVIDLQALLALDPLNADRRLELGLLLAATDPDAALSVLSELEQSDARTARLGREISLAIRRARAISDDPGYLNLISGRALAAAGIWDLAKLAFERAVESNPGYAEAWAFLGVARQRLGDNGKEAILQANALDPGSFVVNLLTALYWQAEGDHEQAIIHLNRALESDPSNPTLIAEMASIVAAAGDIPGALSLFDRAIQSAPDDPTYWELLAVFSIENNIQVESIAVDAARRATFLAPQDPSGFDLLGQAYLASGNSLLAERFLTRATILDADYTPAVFHLGLLYLNRGSDSEARDLFEKVIALSPDSFQAEMAAQMIQQYLQ